MAISFYNSIRFIATLAMTLIIGVGCGASDALDAPVNSGSDDLVMQLSDAQTNLFEHEIKSASEGYAQILAEHPDNSEALAGMAVTRVLLLPYDEHVTELLTCCLGASSELDANSDILYARDGFFYLLSLGVPLEDEEGFPGIKTLLAPDLPWQRAKLNSMRDFFSGLSADVNALSDALWAISDVLKSIEDDLQKVIENESFKSYFLPGEVFHEKRLSVVLGKSEFAALKATFAGARTAIAFVTAYEYDWSLDDAFGAGSDVMPGNPRYVQEWTSDDYALDFLSTVMFRSIRHPERLIEAKFAFRDTLNIARVAIDFGLNLGGYEFDWDEVNPQTAREVNDVLEAGNDALDGRLEIPYSTPSTDVDLSGFFDPGRTLDPSLQWMNRDDSDSTWSFDDDAVEAFWIDGVFNPTFDADDPFEVTFSGEFDDFVESLVGGLDDSVEDAYFSGR